MPGPHQALVGGAGAGGKTNAAPLLASTGTLDTPNIACWDMGLGGGFPPYLGCQTECHTANNNPSKIASNIGGPLGGSSGPKKSGLPGWPFGLPCLLAVWRQNFQAPLHPHLRPKVRGRPRTVLGTSGGLVPKCREHIAAQKYISCYAYGDMCHQSLWRWEKVGLNEP